MVTDETAVRRPIAFPIFLIVGGIIAFIAAFELTLDKFIALEDPKAILNCNISPIVQCGVNLASQQGAVFGFPNPIIGVAGFTAVIAVGVAMLAGAQFARWFWIAFNAGLLFAIGFVIWLMSQSIFILGTLCPWCMVVWIVTIPLFLTVTLRNLGTGVIPSGERARRFFAAAVGWVPLISLVCYLVIAIIAQLRLDFLGSLF